MKYIDLFCGIGSFHYVFKQLGFECVMACDISKTAKEIYSKNYGIQPLGNIVDIQPESITNYDILCAGFPCQPFSNIGKHKGFDDERGAMFFQIMKFVTHHKPKFVILENVSALISHNKGQTFEKIVNILEKHDYDVCYKILKCSDYGIPQMRKRLFIVGIHKDTINNYGIDIKQFFDMPTYECPSLSDFLGKNFQKAIAYTIRCGGRKSPINDKHNWDGYLIDGKEYRLSIDDCLKLQGFENFEMIGSITEQYKVLGNTIPTNLTRLIGSKIKRIIQ